ncbi:ABC transporter ATP-binding protein [Flagellimonas flava]|uniref:ABC-2 type transport system ATP-binding protein n=1 Tax=Flagellimonas flava TaxID=570519 RepID=A0A1M5I6Q2_9FLAO|nr:ABC transporter ATP-binding protein [Allomuricauda flava]SHG23453.1 ABC-2 type transport system ATP-binding protein [Allomuricauda flava]
MLSIKKLHFAYSNSPAVLSNINLNFSTGNIYGLFGKNGEGKSTLLKLMAGLLFPMTGSCNLHGEPTKKRQPHILKDVFLVPEDFELPSLRIGQFEKINSSFYPSFSKTQFYDLLEEFGLSPSNTISKLSFGQKKKVLIAFGIATNTPLLLMDEPTNGLDIPSKSQFRKVMASAVDQGKCIVISTHQVRDLHSLINHVVILDDSKVCMDLPLETISENLWFGMTPKKNLEDVIYTESTLGGRAILARGERDETEIDLELLFNGVIEAGVKITESINSETHA